MPRQYRILRKKGRQSWTTLEPGAHKTIYDRPEVNQAVEVMANNPSIEAVCVRDSAGDLFNVISFTQEAIAPNSFTFES